MITFSSCYQTILKQWNSFIGLILGNRIQAPKINYIVKMKKVIDGSHQSNVQFLFFRLFGTTGYCSACNKVIPAFEMVMRARANVYHLECFACQQCNHRYRITSNNSRGNHQFFTFFPAGIIRGPGVSVWLFTRFVLFCVN